MFKGKNIFIVIYSMLNLLVFLTFQASLSVYISFLISSLVLFFIVIYHLFYERDYSPFISAYIVFSFLFFIVSPISQINSIEAREGARLVNFFLYRSDLVVYTNILIIIFNIVFICSYITMKKKLLNKRVSLVKTISRRYLPVTLLVLFIISIIGFFMSYNFIKEEFFNPNWIASRQTSKMTALVNKKFIFLLPFAGMILCLKYFKLDKKKAVNYLTILVSFLVFFVLLMWFKNPLTEKRNALGPLYLSLIFLFLPKLVDKNIKILSFLFFSMIILFPLTAIITHSDATLLEIYRNPAILIDQMKGGGIVNAFNTLNYDAFINIGVTIDEVSKNGLTFGYQLLGGLLFFVPRSFWQSKPISSGELIGEHLVSDFGFNFTNLSNPLVSEGFINFGIVGVIFYAVILAFVLIKMMQWLQSESALKRVMSFYFAMHLLFLLRGDFTNGFSYYIGPLIAVVFVPRIIEICIVNFLKK